VTVNDGWNRFIETPDSYLQGKAAGLNVIPPQRNTQYRRRVVFKRINSLYATNQPLIIVDGVIFNNTNVGWFYHFKQLYQSFFNH
jgi:hypothetical protein